MEEKKENSEYKKNIYFGVQKMSHNVLCVTVYEDSSCLRNTMHNKIQFVLKLSVVWIHTLIMFIFEDIGA